MRDNAAPHTLAEQGIAALKVGNKIQAAELLKKSLLLDPDQELAWLWLSGAVSSQEEQKFCIQNVTRINPQNQAAKRGLDSLPTNIPAISPFPIQANPHQQPTVILPLQPPPIPHTVAENWFYTLNGQRIGPVKDVDFPRLITTAKVNRNTMVWTQGFSEWMPLKQTKLVSFFTAPPPLTSAATRYAGFWYRTLAWIIDYVIQMVAMVIIIMPLAFALGASMAGTSSATEIQSAGEVLGYAVGILINWLYHTISESSPWQATLGKKLLGLRVTDKAGNRIGFGKANGRYWSKYLSGLILCMGYIMVASTEKKQGLHDKIAGTLVLKV
jgi:uncharacterized RDD family membrane protein YckC